MAAPGDDIPDLLKQHQAALDEMQTLLSDLPSERIDPLCLLRFHLSNPKSTQEAAAKLRKGAEYRVERADFFERVEEIVAELKPYVAQDELPHRSAKGQILAAGIPARHNYEGLAELEETRLVDMFIALNEVNYRHADKATRESGKMVKHVTVVSCRGFGWGLLTHQHFRRFIKAYSKSSEVSQFMYPQMLHAEVLCHAPSWLEAANKILSRWVSAKVLEKHKVPGSVEEVCEMCGLTPALLPVFLGGELDWTPSCLANDPILSALPNHLNISARSTQELSVVVAEGDNVQWGVNAEQGVVQVKIVLVTEAGEEVEVEKAEAAGDRGIVEGICTAKGAGNMLLRMSNSNMLTSIDIQCNFKQLEVPETAR